MSLPNDKLVKAVKLVLALHDNPQSSAPGYLVKLDPKAEAQLRRALLEAETTEEAHREASYEWRGRFAPDDD